VAGFRSESIEFVGHPMSPLSTRAACPTSWRHQQSRSKRQWP